MQETTITVQTIVHAPVAKVWQCWTTPANIVQWNNASPEWHTTTAENDLQPGGRFDYRMEARDESFGFNFTGTYNVVDIQKHISYTLDDGRNVTLYFQEDDQSTNVLEVFEPDASHSHELQQAGWQAILDNFKNYVEIFII